MICRHCHKIIKMNEKRVKKGIRNYHESCIDTIEQQEKQNKKERIKQKQTHLALNEIVLENLAQQGITIVAKPIVEPPKHYNAKEYYENPAAMAVIRDEIQEFEDKCDDNAMAHMELDAVIRELKKEVTVEEMLAEFKQQLQSEKERERKEWDKLFEKGQPVKRELTTNDPLELFHRIRNSRVDKENS
jgi:hypothetical protein